MPSIPSLFQRSFSGILFIVLVLKAPSLVATMYSPLCVRYPTKSPVCQRLSSFPSLSPNSKPSILYFFPRRRSYAVLRLPHEVPVDEHLGILNHPWEYIRGAPDVHSNPGVQGALHGSQLPLYLLDPPLNDSVAPRRSHWGIFGHGWCIPPGPNDSVDDRLHGGLLIRLEYDFRRLVTKLFNERDDALDHMLIYGPFLSHEHTAHHSRVPLLHDKDGLGLLVNLAHEAIVHMRLWDIALLRSRFVVRVSLSAPADAHHERYGRCVMLCSSTSA